MSRIRRAPTRASGAIDRGRRRAPPPLLRAGALHAGRFAGSSRQRTREAEVDHDSPAREQGEDGTGGTVDRRRHTTTHGPRRDEREAAPGRLDPGERRRTARRRPSSTRSRARVRLVGGARLEGALDEAIARHVGRPGLGERADERERTGARRADGASRPRTARRQPSTTRSPDANRTSTCRGGPGGPHPRIRRAEAPTGHAGPAISRPGPGMPA